MTSSSISWQSFVVGTRSPGSELEVSRSACSSALPALAAPKLELLRISPNGTRSDGPGDSKAARSLRFCNPGYYLVSYSGRRIHRFIGNALNFEELRYVSATEAETQRVQDGMRSTKQGVSAEVGAESARESNKNA
jgi:hypothetical protein